METTTIKVSGMTCQGCVRSVTRVLQAIPGVDAVDVSLERGEARAALRPGARRRDGSSARRSRTPDYEAA